MKTIGIVGNGFVGSSVAFGFSPQTGCDADIKVYDKDESKSTHSLSDTLTSEFIFVSVPTPSNPDGSISLSVVYDVFDEISLLNVTNLHGVKIKESNIRENYNLIVVGLVNGDGSYVINPDPHEKLQQSHTLMLMGQKDKLESFKADCVWIIDIS